LWRNKTAGILPDLDRLEPAEAFWQASIHCYGKEQQNQPVFAQSREKKAGKSCPNSQVVGKKVRKSVSASGSFRTAARLRRMGRLP
jgi:hypothetical protein